MLRLGLGLYLPDAILSANYIGAFGSGSDGSAVLDGTTTNGFSTLAGSTYTLTRDVQATSLAVNSGITLKTANFRIFCQGTVTNNGTISNAGNAAIGQAAGLSGGAASLVGGSVGGPGGTGVSGAGSGGGVIAFGGGGGAGGAGTSGAGGAAGTTTFSDALVMANMLATPYPVLVGLVCYANLSTNLRFGSGAGGGGSDAASNSGGGGGGGGGIIAILAAALVNNGLITVQGGAGANGTAGNAGGGGSAAGGAVLVYTLSAVTGSGTVNVAGGTPGLGSGTGSAGSTGGSGLYLAVVLR